MPLLTPHSSPDSQSKNHHWLLLLILLGICGVLYLPAANGPMLLDDRSNLLFNQGIRMQDLSWQSIEQAATSMQETFASRHPWLNRPISFISFGLNHWASSTPHLAMKLTNIALHLINAMLLFILLRMMLRVLSEIDHRQASAIALIATGIWLLHPLMVSTVLYTVQRMTELSTLFILLGLLAFVHFRLRLMNDHHALWQGGALVMLATLCAYLSKENGILLLPLCLLLELSLFRHRFDHMQSRWVKRLYWLLLLLPTLALIYYLAHTLLAAPDYQPSSRTFTQWQRLLSQGPVMVDYLHWFIWPSAEHLAFLHDGRIASQSLFSPIATFWSWLFLLLLLAISVWSMVTKRVIWLGIGLGWFFIGHLLESTVLNLELAFEHRNYLPYAGLALITAVTTQHVLNFFTRISLMQTSLALVLLCTPLTVLTEARTERWQSEERLLEHWQHVAQNSGRYWTKLAAKHVRDQDLSKAFEALKQGSRQVPWEDGFVLGQLTLMCADTTLFTHAQIQSVTQKAQQLLATAPLTAYGITQFATLVSACSQADMRTGLTPLMEQASDMKNRQIKGRAHYLMGVLAKDQGQLNDARQHWQQALQWEPSNQAAREQLTQISAQGTPL